MNRFLKKVYKLVLEESEKNAPETKQLIRLRNQMIKTITTRLEAFSLNTVVSGFMEYTNTLTDIAKKGGVDKKTLETLTVLLAPFAPHLAEEMHEHLGYTTSVFDEKWPEWDEKLAEEDEVKMPVQINGKTKAVISLPKDVAKDDALAAARKEIADKLTGNVVKEIFVPGRIINFVMK